MNLLLRVLYVFLASLWKPKITNMLLPARLKLYVLPNDLDFNLHMNNGRFLTIMDLGRLDLILRSGLLKMMVRQQSVPILASAQMRYRHPLDPFQPYYLETRLIAWDPKWMYLEQRFILARGPKAGEIAAIGLVKGCFYDQRSRTTVPSADLMKLINHPDPSPPLPAHIAEWLKAEEALRDVTKADNYGP